MVNQFFCPNCGSENIQRCSVIYQQGTVGHSYTSRSGNYNVETSGTESTALAQSVAPPQKKDTSWGSMVVTGFLAVMAFDAGNFLFAGILGLIAVGLYMTSSEASEYNEKEWPTAFEN